MPMLLASSPRSDRRRARRVLAAAVALAVLGHLAILGLLLVLPGPPAVTRTKHAPPRPVALRSIRADEWAKNRDVAQQARSVAEPARKKVEKKDETDPKGQVVAVERGNGETSPDAKFLAESSNRVEKETRAREQSRNYVNPTAQRSSPLKNDVKGRDDVHVPVIGGNGGLGQEEAAASKGSGHKAVMEVPRIARRSELKVKRADPAEPGPGDVQVAERLGSEEVRGNSDRLLLVPGERDGEASREGATGKLGVPGLRTLLPSESRMSQIVGAPANDHLDDVEEGEGTFLNTREWKYASFFNRVKQSVSAQWNPGEKLMVRDPTGSIYGGRDRQTMVHVTLDGAGQLKDIYVEKSSGLDFLDREAVQAFERAAPFPHPPPGLLAADSTVRFSFGFYLDMGTGGLRLHGFRQAN